MIKPWPKSPNIIENKKGKVIIVNGAGFISRYDATPYEFTMSWKIWVNLLVRLYVGGISSVSITFSIGWTVAPDLFYKIKFLKLCAFARQITAPRCSACITSSISISGTQHSATKKLPLVSNVKLFRAWYMAIWRWTWRFHSGNPTAALLRS